jgi:branched-subunit amino acid aminotransferase/4-amino-4-deoxychorismate lyase
MSPAPFRSWRADGAGIVAHRGGIPLDDRGFRYGQHLFESIAVRCGSVLLAREHLESLKAAAARQGIPCSRALSKSLGSFLESVSLADGMLRIYLTAGSGAPAAPVLRPGCYLTWEATHFPSDADIAKGYRLITLKQFPARAGWGEKSGNYGAHLDALANVRAKGADEGVVLDERGRVISCAMANLLVWLPSRTGSVLCTPSSSLGARSGTLLGWVRRRMNVEERALTPADLRRAVALAVTNSRLGVMPVASFDGKQLPDRFPSLALALDYLRLHGLLGTA